MRIIVTFFWIIIGAVLLWFFAENLDQHVNIYLFTRTYENVNLITVIFVSTFLGLLFGTLIMTMKLIKAKAQLSGLKKENKRLIQEIQELKPSEKSQSSESEEPLTPPE
ncbi:MAG: LapA family protein [Calditrichaeota bacterium]|nr:LapA family protein [Calditrichota bacterium]